MKNHLLIKADWFKTYKLDRDNAEQRNVEIDAASLADRLAELRDIYSVDAEGNAHVRITGPLSNEGPDAWDVILGYGGTAYPDVRDAVLRAVVETPEDAAIVLDIDSPGGSVIGLDETYQDIFSASQSRPVLAKVHGMATSAAYYLASAADKIGTTSPASMVGSIGVAIHALDFTRALDNAGIEVIEMTNTESPDKRPNLTTDDGRAVVRRELDAIFDLFAARVIQGRATNDPTFTRDTITNLRGSTILANEALEIGLVDAVQDRTKHAATAAQTPKGSNMDLTQFLAENPEAAAEYKTKLEAAQPPVETSPVVEPAPAPVVNHDQAIAVLSSDVYPGPLKALAANVLKNEQSADALSAAVAVHDATIEATKSNAAAQAAAQLPATPAEPNIEGPSASGKIEKPEDIKATIETLARFGL